MPIDPKTGIWSPRLSPKQVETFNLRTRFNLISGPRMSGKTMGVLHRLVKHAWITPGARIGMFTKTIKNAKSGVWDDLTRRSTEKGKGGIIQEWTESGMASDYAEFGYTTEPKIDGATRMHYFRLQDYWGGESEIQLHSLDYDGDIEAILFGTRFSMLYFSELQHFKSPAIFKAAIQQLRMLHLKYEQHEWIADTNPPEEGPDHFAHDIFFKERLQENHPDPEFQKQLSLIEIGIEDNPFLDPRQIRDLKATYANDPEAYARFILGKWTYSAGNKDKHFASLFKPTVHVLGSIDSPNEEEWEVILPSAGCQTLLGGWDLGEANHSAHIAEKWYDERGRPHFNVLDEHAVIQGETSIEEFTLDVVELMDRIEAIVPPLPNRKGPADPVTWRHWSDESAWRFKAAGIEKFDALIVETASRGKIRLMSAKEAKRPGCVRKRVDILKQLLAEDRIHISANCVGTIEMFKELRKGKTNSEFVVRTQKHKHRFDSLSYIIYSELLDDLEIGDTVEPQTGSRLISVGF